jgi:peptidyl-prolyl isomerase D
MSRLAKALYRQGLAHIALHDEDRAEESLRSAYALAKDDAVIAAELERLKQRKKAKVAKEKAAYKKMFN